MPNMRIEIDDAGVRELLKSRAVQDDLARRGQRIANAAGDGFAVERGTRGKTRTRVFVQAETAKARRAEATNRALSKSLDAGR